MTAPAGLYQPITPQQKKVAALILEGLSYQEIGDALGLSRRTVERHVYLLVDKIESDRQFSPWFRVYRWARDYLAGVE